MDNHPETDVDSHTDGHVDAATAARRRFERAIRGVGKRKPGTPGKPLKSATNEATKFRHAQMATLVRLGMSVEQMVDYLSAVGVTVSRSLAYEYVAEAKLPRGYRPSERQQSHHDFFTFRSFVRIAQDAAKAGHRASHFAKGTAPYEGARFRPDFGFSVGRYRFYVEMQLSDLTETLWSKKMRNYVRMRKELGKPFRALFIIDQKGDMAYARRHARQIVERETVGRGIFLFVRLDEIKGSKNLATDPVWIDPWGRATSLLQFLPLPGQKPTVQRQ